MRLKNINDSPGKRMKQKQATGYWEVIFHGETQPMRTDNEFVSQFKKGFLDEVKRQRCGFVDIPLGDFKELHLHNYPNLTQFLAAVSNKRCHGKTTYKKRKEKGNLEFREKL
jgi:hypothetical protein